jgi:hypothetical protein
MPAPGNPTTPPPDTILPPLAEGAPIPESSLDTGLWSVAQSQAPYGTYAVDSTYATSNGVLQIPLGAAPGTPPVLIQLHAGWQRKTVGVLGRRVGVPPLLPDPTQLDPDGGVTASVSISPRAPVLDSDGNTYLYQAAMTSTFYYDKFIGPLQGYRMGAAPVYTTPPSSNVLDTFSLDIL